RDEAKACEVTTIAFASVELTLGVACEVLEGVGWPFSASTGFAVSTPVKPCTPPTAKVAPVTVHAYDAGSLAPAVLRYTASEFEVGPALSMRRTSVQPEGGVIATEEGVTAIEATSASFNAVPEGLVMVSVPV